MFKPLKKIVLLAAFLGGGFLIYQTVDLKGLEKLKLSPAKSGLGSMLGDGRPLATREADVIRVASFNIQVFGESKLANANVMRVLAQVARNFDVVAIQEIRSAQQDILPRFVDAVNAEGRLYDYVIGPRLGRTSSKEQYALLYDTESIEVDRPNVYTIDDPDDRLHREPLVAGFRVRGPAPDQAFTFTLINVHTDPDEVPEELDALRDVFLAVRDDGRNEDDIILLGDLNADDTQFGRLGQISEITCVISGVPTNTRGTKQYDNLLFHRRATTEFTGKGGVVNLQKEFNLTLEQALEVSDHFPVWAEFSIYEGGQPGRLARAAAR